MSIKVLIVEDSAFMRKVISDMLNSDPAIEVVATANNGIEALEKIIDFNPDVITLDVEMPKMNGINTLKQIMINKPTPVVMLSNVTRKDSKITMEALSLGAIDFVPKPSGSISLDLEKVKDKLLKKVKNANRAKIPVLKTKPSMPIKSPEKIPEELLPVADKIIVIGSSTGGPKALEQILTQLPAKLSAGILIAQHMSEGFTDPFASRLNHISHIRVKEAKDGDVIKNGQALIAPGNRHLKVNKKRVRVTQEDPVLHVRPSANVLMESAVKYYKSNIIGIVLTGMGKDGAQGMKLIKKAGGKTIVQDKTTSIIFSMPNSAIKEKAADLIVALPNMPEQIISFVQKN